MGVGSKNQVLVRKNRSSMTNINKKSLKQRQFGFENK
jgi:hypothetical protein